MEVEARERRIVGREPELERVEAALEELASGESACLAIAGDPGIGKTRLLGELRERSEERGLLVLAGAAAEFERDLPFSVWIDALDSYVASQKLGENPAFTADLAGELGGILPSLSASQTGNGTAIADERYRAHRAMRGLLELIAEEHSLVLVLDDLHWSDQSSIELIAALLRRAPHGAVLLALAYRAGQAPQRLAAALAAPDVTRLKLEPLNQAQAAQLLGGVEARALAAMYNHAGGNPFYLEQLARGGMPAGHGSGPASGNGGGVPAAVAASLAEELEALSPAARGLLEAASVTGEPFEPDLAAAVAEMPQGDGLDALDELLASDLVRPTQEPRRFGFRHPLVRRAVYEGTRGGWRLGAHARAAAELAGRGAAATERAHHVEQAARQGDEDAIALLIEAGDDAAPRAPAAAARWFAAAQRLLPEADRGRQVALRVKLASALRSQGELQHCRDTLLAAIEMLPSSDVARRGELTALCASVEHWLGRHDEAHQRLLRARGELPERTTVEAAALEIELAVDAMYTLDFDQVREMGEAALDTARALEDRPLIAAAAALLALGAGAEGRMDSARERWAEAVAQVDALSDAELAPRLEALYYLGWAENYLERWEQAIAHAERGVAIARATGEGRLLVPMMLVRNYPLQMAGRLAESLEMCETAIEVARLSANPHYLFWALFELAWAKYFLGDLDGVIAAGEESLRVGGSMSGATMPSAGGGPGWALATARLEGGDPARARAEMLAHGGDMLHQVPIERCFGWEGLTLAELALGNLDAADAWATRAEEDAAQLGMDLPMTFGGRARAAVLLAQGRGDEAVKAAEASVAAGRRSRARLETAYSLAMLGRALAAAGERTRAISTLREAEQELDACGSIRPRDEVRRDLRKLGARAEPRGPAAGGLSGLEALTKREHEIADLITDRMTNREIAQALFLSDKTVESHLRNIFVKLGVSSRVDVARAVERGRVAGP